MKLSALRLHSFRTKKKKKQKQETTHGDSHADDEMKL